MARNVSTIPILNLPVAVSLDGSEWAPLVQGDVTRRAQTGLIASFPTVGAQHANTVWAGPTTGSPSAPTFRALVPADLPDEIIFPALEGTHGGWSISTPQESFNGTEDPTLVIGYNYLDNVSGEPIWTLQMEADYNDGARHISEAYFQFTSSDGNTQLRPIVFGINRSNNTVYGMGIPAGSVGLRIYKDDAQTDVNTIFTSTGRVGINKGTDPNFTLDVDGDANISLASAFRINEAKALNHDATYASVYEPTNNRAGLAIGNTGDPSNYYDNTSHFFRTRPQVNLASITADGISIPVAGAYQIASTNALKRDATYTSIYDGAGHIGFSTGNTGDQSNYYDNDNHILRTRLGVNLATLFSTGLTVVGSTGAGVAVSSASWLKIAAGTTAKAQINLPTSTAPSAPADGDIWREDNTTTGLKIRINGVTKTIVVA